MLGFPVSQGLENLNCHLTQWVMEGDALLNINERAVNEDIQCVGL